MHKALTRKYIWITHSHSVQCLAELYGFHAIVVHFMEVEEPI